MTVLVAASARAREGSENPSAGGGRHNDSPGRCCSRRIAARPSRADAGQPDSGGPAAPRRPRRMPHESSLAWPRSRADERGCTGPGGGTQESRAETNSARRARSFTRPRWGFTGRLARPATGSPASGLPNLVGKPLDVGRGAPKAGRAGAAGPRSATPLTPGNGCLSRRLSALGLSSSPPALSSSSPPARHGPPGGRKSVHATYSADHGDWKGVCGKVVKGGGGKSE